MKNNLAQLHRPVIWLWKHCSAAIALILILLALAIGYSVGQGSSELLATATDHNNAHADDVDELAPPAMYTCSMHPSVRLPDADAKCPICFMDLIPVDSSASGGELNQLVLSESAAAMSRVETAKVTRFFPTARVRLFGKIGFDETSVARLSAYFSGRIDRLFVNYIGVPVRQGDHLAEIYSPELISAFEELKLASISVANSADSSSFIRDTARQTLAAAKDKLRLFGLTQDQVLQIESGTFDTTQLTIYAPIGGVVTHLAVREGDYVQTGDPIATVADLSRLWLDLEAYESQLPMLNWGQKVTFTVEAHPGEQFTGQISFIEPFIDERTRTAVVRVAVDNTDGRLKPGMFTTAIAQPKMNEHGAVLSDELAGKWISPMHPTIVKDEPGSCDVCGMDLVRAETLGVVGDSTMATKPLVIPRSAVLFTGPRSVVYVKVPGTEQPTYEGRAILLGPRAGEFYTVRSGLEEGEDVVVHGAFRIDSAMQVLAKPSMMMPQGGPSGTGHHQHGQQPSTIPAPAIEHSFLEAISPIYEAYFDAQEALADDDLDLFIQERTKMQQAAARVNESSVIGAPLSLWRKSKSQLLVDADLSTIVFARIHFETMSKAVMILEEQFGHLQRQTWHVAFCPMAFDFEGANWIQRNTEINNPYFGDQMLRCGDILGDLPSSAPRDQSEHTHD